MTDKECDEVNWIVALKNNPEFKKKFLEGLQRLGFPLEFRIRKKLKDLGFANVREGYFTQKINGMYVTKSFDISANKSRSKKILDEVTVHMDLNLIVECKFSSDENKLLFAVPESGNPQNKNFVGPILSNLQVANYGVYRNMELVSDFLSKFGGILFASDIKDSSKKFIMSEQNLNKEDTPEYEKIFDICENTILPALKNSYLYWRNSARQDYAKLFRDVSVEGDHLAKQLKKEFFTFKVIIPIIVTSKPILIPIFNEENMAILSVDPIDYLIYEHSVQKPYSYSELINYCPDVAVFISTEKGFDKLIEYVNKLADQIHDTITSNLAKHPNRFFEDFKDIEANNREIEARKEHNL